MATPLTINSRASKYNRKVFGNSVVFFFFFIDVCCYGETHSHHVPMFACSALLSAVKLLNNRICCVRVCAELFGGNAYIKHMLDLNVLWGSMVLSLDWLAGSFLFFFFFHR